MVAANGPALARHVVYGSDVAAGLLAGVVEPSYRIDGLPGCVDHASGGPVHYDDASGLLLLVYHGERFVGGDATQYVSFLGMAVSYDEGANFADLGPIVTVAEPDSSAGVVQVDVGSGAFVVRDGWFYVYYQDRSSDRMRINLAVARCRLGDVITAASRATAPEFVKWFEGAFAEPGIDGRESDLLDRYRAWLCWFDAIQLAPGGPDGTPETTAIVFSTVVGYEAGEPGWVQQLLLSDDGVHWRGPISLGLAPDRAELIYVTLDSTEADPRRSTTGSIDLYRTRSTSSFRWDNASLERVRIELSLDTL